MDANWVENKIAVDRPLSRQYLDGRQFSRKQNCENKIQPPPTPTESTKDKYIYKIYFLSNNARLGD